MILNEIFLKANMVSQYLLNNCIWSSRASTILKSFPIQILQWK